jgi:hypothetical protein
MDIPDSQAKPGQMSFRHRQADMSKAVSIFQ